uniref:DUF655 domain-containing protein n=1 Tax=Fervidicoccus fontis TaxID=683846 RepID=A0A7J3ZJN0_9CREN
MYGRRGRDFERGPPRRRERWRPPEDFAVILDFLPQGNPFDRHPEHRREPLVQAVGDRYFTLVEITTKMGEDFRVGEKIYINPEYIGKGPITGLYGPVRYEELTNVAKDNLVPVLEEIVKEKERVFANLFNIAEPITLKMHALELLPGIGKKCLMVILEERKTKPFESFEDLERRLSLRGLKMQPLARLIAERIAVELRGGERYYMFVRPREGEEQARYLGLLERLYLVAERG